MLRSILVFSLAALVLLSIGWYRSHTCAGISYIGFEAWSPMLLMASERMSLDLLPGLIVGALLRSRQVVAGALVSIACGPAIQGAMLNYCWQEWPSSISLGVSAIEFGIYGAAGAALGYVSRVWIMSIMRRPVV